MSAGQPPDLLTRYQRILGIEGSTPNLVFLTALVRAQLTRVPFENISKLYLKKTHGAGYIPSLSEHLDGIERFNFGGTCYANNPYFNLLLGSLGYDVTLCGADMSNPDVHIVSIVRLEGHEYVVDVGYAAPFYEPLPRDLDVDHEIGWGRCQYILRPQNEAGRSRLEMYRDGELTHGYVAKPKGRTIGHFDTVIRNSYQDSATFMNALVVERFLEDRSVRIHNYSLTESTPNESRVTRLHDRDEVIQAVEYHCGIPGDVVREAIDGIDLEADIYT